MRKRSAQILEDCASESVEEEEDGITTAGKYTIRSTVALMSTCEAPFIRPFSNFRGCKIMQGYPDFYVGDTKQGNVFKINDVKLTNQCSGRLRKLHPAASTNKRTVPAALVFHEDRLFIANSDTNKLGIVGIHANRGTPCCLLLPRL